MKVFTIGFTQKKAELFFSMLRNAKIQRLLDVRLNNVSQLSGFAKRDDLAFFLRELCDVDYLHVPELAPTQKMLKAYKQKEMTWESYEAAFLNLMAQRNIEHQFKPEQLMDGCLLCSEASPHFCHRRLVTEYLNHHWGTKLDVEHLY